MFGFTLMDAPEAAQKLAAGIEQLSQRHWQAGWLDGCEVFLWMLVAESGDDDVEWGDAFITPEEVGVLRALAAECNGWVSWSDSDSPDPTTAFLESGPRYVPMGEWLKHYAEQVSAEADAARRRYIARCL